MNDGELGGNLPPAIRVKVESMQTSRALLAYAEWRPLDDAVPSVCTRQALGKLVTDVGMREVLEPRAGCIAIALPLPIEPASTDDMAKGVRQAGSIAFPRLGLGPKKQRGGRFP